MKLAVVSNENGISFMVRIVEYNDSYGHNMCLTHAEEMPMIEFYDTRYKFARYGDIILGQFVNRYYVKTLVDDKPIRNGLCLYGGIPDWQLDVKAVKEVMGLLKMWGLD